MSKGHARTNSTLDMRNFPSGAFLEGISRTETSYIGSIRWLLKVTAIQKKGRNGQLPRVPFYSCIQCLRASQTMLGPHYKDHPNNVSSRNDQSLLRESYETNIKCSG
jgi:hypothetical protein